MIEIVSSSDFSCFTSNEFSFSHGYFLQNQHQNGSNGLAYLEKRESSPSSDRLVNSIAVTNSGMRTNFDKETKLKMNQKFVSNLKTSLWEIPFNKLDAISTVSL